eukprot:gene5325-6638_t
MNNYTEAIQWLFSNFIEKRGSLLADDMGLGKTKTVVSFLKGMYNNKLISSPKSVLTTWIKELESLNLSFRIQHYDYKNITATPFPNNLKEFWTIFNWFTDGKLLGTEKYFMENFGKKVTDSHLISNTKFNGLVELEALKILISGYVLRRKKGIHFNNEILTSKKTDWVIWS